MIDGSCQLCSYPSVYIYGKCVKCPANSNYVNDICVCSEGLYMINGYCSSCGLNEIYNGYQCVCIDGYTRNSYTNQCTKNSIPTCGINQYWDSVNGVCNCNSGYTWMNGQCTIINKCDVYSYWNGFKCVCRTGFVYN